MQEMSNIFLCFFLFSSLTNFINCCHRCPDVTERNCKSADDFSTELKRIQEINQLALANITLAFQEQRKVVLYMQEAAVANKMTSSFLPMMMRTQEMLSDNAEKLKIISNKIEKVSDRWNKTEKFNLEDSERKLNFTLQSLITAFDDRFSNLTKAMKLELQPFDCYDALQSGKTTSGVYRIYPEGAHDVFCDMETEGGGWTVFLFRQKQPHQENFYRSWQNYKDGFGNPYAEYWLGNEALFSMTRFRKYAMRLEAQAEGAEDIWGEWRTFSVNSESSKYQVSLSNLTEASTVYNDHLEGYFSNRKFSTFDADNDDSGGNCAADYKGGWWYNDCKNVNPTGVYGVHSNEGIDFNNWSIYDSQERYATWLQLKIRPN